MKQRLLPILILLLTPLWVIGEEEDFSFEDPFSEEVALPLVTIWELDFTHEFRIDLNYVSQDNFRFGKFNGLNEMGFHPAVSWELINRPGLSDTQDTHYWTFSAVDLGLKTAAAEFSIGEQGNYGLTIDFSSINTVANDTGVTPFRGDEVLRLPNTWVPALSTPGMTASAAFDQVEPEVQRNSLNIEFNKHFGNAWMIEAMYGYETKDGEKLTGAVFYSDAANPHAAIVPEPVDFESSEFDFNLEYSGADLQVALSYHFSDFDNKIASLRWQNPYSGAFSADVDYPNGFGEMALAPDHQFQQVRARGTYRLTPKIRLQFNGTSGKTEHKGKLLPYTANPLLTVATALPTSQLDDLDTASFYVGLIANPTRRVSLNFKYWYEERDNTMARFPWLYVRGDSRDQPVARRAIFNNPQHVTKERISSEVTFRTTGRTRYTLIYDYEEVTRSLVSVEETEEDKLSAIVKLYPWDKFSVRFEIAHSDLAASTYQWAESFFNRFTVEQINMIPDNRRWTNHPLLRQDNLANRQSYFAKANITYWPVDSLNFIFEGDYQYHDYDKSVLGLRSRSQVMLNLSANYTPDSSVNIYGWLNYGAFETEQSGRSFRGGVEQPANEILPPLPQGSDPTRDWEVEEEVETLGFGAGVKWIVVQDKFDLTADYVYTKTTIEHDFSTNGATDILGVPLPEVDSLLHQLVVSGNYHVGKNLSLQWKYQYFRFSDEDWARNGVNVSTLPKVLGLGERNPNEVINMISMGMTYRY